MRHIVLIGFLALIILLINPPHNVTQQEEVDVTEFVELDRIGRGAIISTDISPDGAYLAVASENIWIYNLETLEIVKRIESYSVGFLTIAWSPDGQLLAAGAANDSVYVWATDSWQETTRFEGVNLLPLLSIAWSPDSRYLVFPGQVNFDRIAEDDGVLNHPAEVYIWDVVTGPLTYQLVGLTGQIMTVSWSPDGTKVAAGNEFGDIIVWDANTGTPMNMKRPPVYGRVSGLKWSPDSKILAISTESSDSILWDFEQVVISFEKSQYNEMSWSHSGSWIAGTFDGELRIWNVEEEVFTQTLKGHTSYIFDIVWSPDDSLLVTSSRDGTLRVWDTRTWQTIRRLDEHFFGIRSLAWSPSASQIAFAQDRAITIWNLATQSLSAVLTEHSDNVTDIKWSPDGNSLASSDYDGNVFIWDGQNHRLERTFRSDAWVLSLAWSPNGSYLAYASGHKIVVRETNEWNLIAEFLSHEYNVEPIRWSSDGSRLATLSWPDIKIWLTSTWQLERSTPTVQAKDFAWSPDGQFIASANLDGITIWDSLTGGLHATRNQCDSLSRNFDDITWVPGGRQLITVGCAGRIQVWNYENGKILRTLPIRNSFARIVWSPDGTRFAISGGYGTIPIWGMPE